MSGDKLSALQWRILERLSSLEPRWTLTGGGALAGFHLKHRTTRDLDLFWHGLNQLGSLPEEVRSNLVSEGLEVTPIQSGNTFSQLRVSDGAETCTIDLVAIQWLPWRRPYRSGSVPHPWWSIRLTRFS